MLELTHYLFIFSWTDIAQRRMSPNPVIGALDILEDGLPGLPSCLEGNTLDAFAFERPEKGFGDRVIVTVPSAAHAHYGVDIREQGLRLHHWYIAIHDQNETASQLVGADQAAPSEKPSQ
jgi:hypothetical protein